MRVFFIHRHTISLIQPWDFVLVFTYFVCDTLDTFHRLQPYTQKPFLWCSTLKIYG